MHLLNSLDYPYAYDLTDPASVATLVAWVEDRKVRIWDIERRAPLREVRSGWGTVFGKYLEDLGCPVVPGPTTVAWLLRAAIDSEFDDDVDGTIMRDNAFAACAACSVWRVDNVRASLGTAGTAGAPEAAVLGACMARVAAAHDRTHATGGTSRVDEVPTFSTGDTRVDEVATRMRLVYVADLRVLQDKVNGILARAQDFLAKPSTNGALGKVGR